MLSPTRGSAHGVVEINRLVQKQFRSKTIDFAQTRYRKIPRPMGPEGIVYGDKVINLVNHARHRAYPKDALKYIANGEIGIAVGQWKTPNMSGLPWNLQINFSSQPDHTYDFSARDFGEESSPAIELAYAITVHKSQGSDFGIVFLILPQNSRILSRELLYTALTRQKDKIIILQQGHKNDIKKYSSAYYSETARRLTNLFYLPSLIQLDDVYMEEYLIHRTRKGEPVRSKSEVIIADMLSFKGIDYSYERKLVGSDGATRIPDFTIEDDASGNTYHWEHLGLLHDPGYKKRWDEKIKWYRSQGILPLEEGKGENGTLIITKDTDQGGISSVEIEQLIDSVFND